MRRAQEPCSLEPMAALQWVVAHEIYRGSLPQPQQQQRFAHALAPRGILQDPQVRLSHIVTLDSIHVLLLILLISSSPPQ